MYEENGVPRGEHKKNVQTHAGKVLGVTPELQGRWADHLAIVPSVQPWGFHNFLHASSVSFTLYELKVVP